MYSFVDVMYTLWEFIFFGMSFPNFQSNADFIVNIFLFLLDLSCELSEKRC
jgi:hypothetical protein